MNKIYFKLGLSGGVLAGLLGLISRVGAFSYVDVDATSVSTTIAYISNLFADVQVFIWLAIGLPLGFWVIRKTIGLVSSRVR